MYENTDFDALFQVARDSLLKYGFDDSIAFKSSQDARTVKERLLLYLGALQKLPLKKDPDALKIIRRLAHEIDDGSLEGIDINFSRTDKPLREQTVPIENLRDRVLRVELARLIERIESSY